MVGCQSSHAQARTMLTLPSLPDFTNSAASMMWLQLRHCEPI